MNIIIIYNIYHSYFIYKNNILKLINKITN